MLQCVTTNDSYTRSSPSLSLEAYLSVYHEYFGGVLLQYLQKTEVNKALNLLSQSLEIVKTRLCHVHNIEHDNPGSLDLYGSMLSSVVNSMTHATTERKVQLQTAMIREMTDTARLSEMKWPKKTVLEAVRRFKHDSDSSDAISNAAQQSAAHTLQKEEDFGRDIKEFYEQITKIASDLRASEAILFWYLSKDFDMSVTEVYGFARTGLEKYGKAVCTRLEHHALSHYGTYSFAHLRGMCREEAKKLKKDAESDKDASKQKDKTLAETQSLIDAIVLAFVQVFNELQDTLLKDETGLPDESRVRGSERYDYMRREISRSKAMPPEDELYGWGEEMVLEGVVRICLYIKDPSKRFYVDSHIRSLKQLERVANIVARQDIYASQLQLAIMSNHDQLLYTLLDDPQQVLHSAQEALVGQAKTDAITNSLHYSLLHNKATAVQLLLNFGADALKLYSCTWNQYNVFHEYVVDAYAGSTASAGSLEKFDGVLRAKKEEENQNMEARWLWCELLNACKSEGIKGRGQNGVRHLFASMARLKKTYGNKYEGISAKGALEVKKAVLRKMQNHHKDDAQGPTSSEANQALPSFADLLDLFTKICKSSPAEKRADVLYRISKTTCKVKFSAICKFLGIAYPFVQKDMQWHWRPMQKVVDMEIDHNRDGMIDFAEFCDLVYTAWDLSSERAKKLYKCRRGMWLFTSMVQSMMGRGSSYDIVTSSCVYTDLLYWSLLMNRHDLSLILWRKCTQPVWAAMSASTILRQMSSKGEIHPRIRKMMLEQAATFEHYAVQVQKIAMDLDHQLALRHSEMPLSDWKHMTLLDLAVYGQAEDFLECCCEEALTYRLSGDLDPYTQHLTQHLGLLFSDGAEYRLSLLFNLVTLGLLAPFAMIYSCPPLLEMYRLPTQLRSRPKGYPFLHDPKNVHDSSAHDNRIRPITPGHENSLDGLLTVKEKKENRRKRCMQDKLESNPEKYMWRLVKGGDEGLNEIWKDTFTYRERLYLFWKSPMILFAVQNIWRLGVTGTFTYLLYAEPGGAQSKNHLAPTVQVWEVVLAVYFGGYLFAVVTELMCSKSNWINLSRSYFSWIIIDVVACLSYVVPFALWRWSWQLSSPLAAVGVERNWSRWLYSVSASAMWVQSLRTFALHRTLGPLVIIFRRMVQDAGSFMLILLILILACAILIDGALPQSDDTWEQCVATQDQDAHGIIARCHNLSWVFFRAIFQALGDPMLDDMAGDLQVPLVPYVGVLLLFVFVNIIALNLLIAIMSNSFNEVQQQAQKQWMKEQYSIIEAQRATPLALPSPFNVPCMLYNLADFAQRVARGTEHYPLTGGGFRLFLTTTMRPNAEPETTPGGDTALKIDDVAEAAETLAFMQDARNRFVAVMEKEDTNLEETLFASMFKMKNTIVNELEQLDCEMAVQSAATNPFAFPRYMSPLILSPLNLQKHDLLPKAEVKEPDHPPKIKEHQGPSEAHHDSSKSKLNHFQEFLKNLLTKTHDLSISENNMPDAGIPKTAVTFAFCYPRCVCVCVCVAVKISAESMRDTGIPHSAVTFAFCYPGFV